MSSQLEKDCDAYAMGQIKKRMWEAEEMLEEMLERANFSREQVEAILYKLRGED